MDMNVGVVGFSFGLRANEPNPSNCALAERVVDVVEYVDFHDSIPTVVTQWEITKALLERLGFSVDHSVELRADGTYLDSRAVWEEAKAEFIRLGITQVIIVAQPFLHLPSLKKMVRDDGFEVIDCRFGAIPFDNTKLNTQPWTRTKRALILYAVRAVLGMKGGHNGMQNAN